MRDIKYNKIFGIYSLILPIILVGLFFICVKFGTTISDVKYSPYGKISDFITYFSMLVICPLLFIINAILFYLTEPKKDILLYIGLYVVLFFVPLGILAYPVVFYFMVKKAGKYGKNVRQNASILSANLMITIQIMFLLGTMWAILMLIFVGPIYLIMWLIYLIYFIINYRKLYKKENLETDIETTIKN